MELTVLGSGAAYPRPGGACSGYLVRADGATVWLDAGNGTLSRFFERATLDELDAVVLSHSHADHISDVLPLMYALGFDVQRAHPLPIYAPPDVPAKLLAVLGAGSKEMFKRVFDVRRLDGPFAVGNIQLDPFRVVHPVETYGVRLTNGNSTFAYTSDTSAFAELATYVRGVDLLLSEATYVGDHEADPDVHMWAREAGSIAAAAEVSRVLVTHVWPTFGLDEAVREARTTFAGALEAAEEGKSYSV